MTSTSEFEGDIAIDDGRIVAVGAGSAMPAATSRINVTGKLVFPGAIDCHVHFDNADPYEEGMQAAARSGITTVIPFATYDIETQETIAAAIDRLNTRLANHAALDYSLNFIVEHTPYVLDGLAEAFDMGVTCMKAFMTFKRRPHRMCPDGFLLELMRRLGALGGMLQLHCELGDVVDQLENEAIAAGRVRPTDYPTTCPPWVEAQAIGRAIELGAEAGCSIYVVHLSTREGLERIVAARAAGQQVWTETCPQYLLLDERLLAEYGPLAKISPPLRSTDGRQQEAMWRGTSGGEIACIGSDHAPGRPELKARGYDNVFVDDDGNVVPFGAPGVETLVPLVHGEGVAGRGLPRSWMARVLSENPARLFGLYPHKGTIQPGADADLLVIDPGQETTISAAALRSNAGYSLYEGRTVRGRAWMSLLRGQVVMRDGELVEPAKSGQFVPAGLPKPPLASVAP